MILRLLLAEERDIARVDLLAIASHVLSVTTERLLSEPDLPLDHTSAAAIRRLAAQRRLRRPVAYITGHKEFFSTEFLVDDRVLIPRPESEVLVEEALRLLEDTPEPAVLDVGCGSGALGIVIGIHAGARVVCTDLSEGALRVARMNADRLSVAERVATVRADLVEAFRPGSRFDAIVANLPYVPAADWVRLMPDVRDYEPAAALIGGADGLDLYRRLIPRVPGLLRSGGYLLCEIDGGQQAEALARLCRDAGPVETRVVKDLGDRERVVVASWTSL